MSDNDIKIKIDTAVENQKDVTALQKEILKLGRSSETVDNLVDELVSTISKLSEVENIKSKIEESNAAFAKSSDEYNKAKDSLEDLEKEMSDYGASMPTADQEALTKKIKDQKKEVEKLEKAVEKSSKAQKNANDELAAASTEVQDLINDSAAYNAALEDLARSQAALNEEMAGIQKVGDAYKKLGVRDLKKEIEELEDAYKTLEESGTLSAEELRDAHDRMTSQIEEMRASLNGTAAAYGELKDGAKNLLPIAAIFAAASYSAIQYEEAMADVKKVITATDEQFKGLSDSLLEMSKTTPVSAEGLAEIAAAGAQLGVEVENLKEFVTITADMATAFDMTAENAGNAVASLSNIFGISINETEKLADAINHLSNNSAAQANQIVDVLVKIGGTGKAIGLTQQQVAALGSTLISFGKTADIAGTSINGILGRLQVLNTLGAGGQKALDKIGISAVEMSQRLREDAAGAIVYFLEQVNKIDDASEKMSVLTQIFDRGARADVLLMASNVDVLRKQLNMVGDSSKYLGSMQKESAERAKTTAAQLEILKNNVNALSITLGSRFLPIINSTAGGLVSIVEAVTKFTETYPFITKFVIQLALLPPAIKLISASLKLLKTNAVAAAGSMKTLGLSIISQTRLASLAILPTNSLAAAMTGLGLAVASVTGALIALNKWMDAYEEQAEASAAKTKALNEEIKIGLNYLERGIILQKDGTIAIDKNTQATYKGLKAIREQETEQDKLNRRLKEEADALEIVNAILAKTGKSVEELQTNISSNSREVIDDFNKIANSGAATSKVLSYQLAEALKSVKTTEEMSLLTSEFNMLAEQGKISASVVVLFKDELNKLSESFKNGTISEAEFTEQKTKLIDVLNQQVKSMSQVNAELAKQIELINIQLEQDKQVTESLIRKLEAQKKLAEAQGNTAQAQQLQMQIDRARIDLMNRESGLIKQNVTLLKQELEVLLKRQKLGEKLTEQELARIKALQAEITARENEAEAIKISAQAKEQDALSADKNAKSLDNLVGSINSVADAQRNLNSTLSNTNEAIDRNTRSTRRTVGAGRQAGESMKVTSHILNGMADDALMSAAANDELTKSINKMNLAVATGGMGIASSQHSKLQNSIASQINYFTELEKKIGDIENASYDQIEVWQRMANSLQYVNKENIDGLKKQLEAMKNAALNLYADLDSKNADLFNQLNGMRWADESYRMRTTQQNELLRLEEELNKAREQGDNEVIRRLEKQKALTIQIHNQQRKDAKTTAISKREEKKTVDININGEDVSRLDPNDPRFIRKLTDEVVKVIKGDYDRSTASKAARIR